MYMQVYVYSNSLSTEAERPVLYMHIVTTMPFIVQHGIVLLTLRVHFFYLIQLIQIRWIS